MYVAAVEDVTWNVIVHVPGDEYVPAGTEPPVRVTELAVDVTVPPLHWGEAGVPYTVKPVGNGSVNSTPVNAVDVELRIVRVTVLVPPTWKLVGLKDLSTRTV